MLFWVIQDIIFNTYKNNKPEIRFSQEHWVPILMQLLWLKMQITFLESCALGENFKNIYAYFLYVLKLLRTLSFFFFSIFEEYQKWLGSWKIRTLKARIKLLVLINKKVCIHIQCVRYILSKSICLLLRPKCILEAKTSCKIFLMLGHFDIEL